MSHVFISYSRKDADFADMLREQVKDAGFDVWMDSILPAGFDWRQEIDQAIRTLARGKTKTHQQIDLFGSGNIQAPQRFDACRVIRYGAVPVRFRAGNDQIAGFAAAKVQNQTRGNGHTLVTEGRVDTALISGSDKDTNTDLTFGAGVKFDMTRNVALRAEWQRYKDMGGDDTGESDMDVLSVGVLYRF